MFYETDDFFDFIPLGSNFVIQVLSVEAVFKKNGILHPEVFQYVKLHLRRCGSRKGNDGYAVNRFYDGSQPAVFRTKIMAPLRNTMGFINGKKTDFDATEKFNVFFFSEAFRRHEKNFGDPGHDVGFNAIPFSFIKRRIKKVGHTFRASERPDAVHLIFHEGYERRNYDRSSLTDERGQLITK